MQIGLTIYPAASSRRLLFAQWLLFAIFGLVCLSPAMAQEATFEQLKEQWKTLKTKLDEKKAALEAAGADSDGIQKELTDLLGQADKLITKLETSAHARLKNEPENQDCIRTLMGIMLNDAHKDRDAKVLEAGHQLIKLGINPQYFQIASKSDRLSIAAREIFDELILRPVSYTHLTLPTKA